MTYRPRVLQPIGVTPDEERVYELLLEHPSWRVKELTQNSQLSRSALRRALQGLLVKHMIERRAEGHGFVPMPPDVAVVTLIQHRQRELDQANAAAKRLVEVFRHGDRGVRSDFIDVLAGPDAIAQRLLQMLDGARAEWCILVRPPYTLGPSTGTEIEHGLRDRGVRVRTISEPSVLELPGLLSAMEEEVRLGVGVRILPALPFKMALADRRAALVAAGEEAVPLSEALYFETPPLVTALSIAFESLWRDAHELRVPTRETKEPDVGVDVANRRVLSLLAAGVKDESIARALGISRATVERRIKRLMDTLGTSTRFQLGFFASQHGVLQAEE